MFHRLHPSLAYPRLYPCQNEGHQVVELVFAYAGVQIDPSQIAQATQALVVNYARYAFSFILVFNGGIQIDQIGTVAWEGGITIYVFWWVSFRLFASENVKLFSCFGGTFRVENAEA